jgi:hypothetical protein
VPESEAPPRVHPIRNYLIFAILTIGAIAAGGLLLSSRAEKENRRGTSNFGLSESCSLTGQLVSLPEISEASGLALSRATPDLLWTHEDSSPVLFALDIVGRLKGRVRLNQAPIEDWEDLAIGPCGGKTCLYIADIGDNRSKRDHITVYRVPEPNPTDSETAPAEAFHATYPEGPRDAEALFVSGEGGLYVVTKGSHTPITLYRFPEPLRAGTTVRLEPVVTLFQDDAARSDRVTGAATSPDGRWVALRTHNAVLFYEAAPLMGGKPTKPLRYDVSWLRESQAEGVAIGNEGGLYLISEGGATDAPGLLAHGVCKLPGGPG